MTNGKEISEKHSILGLE